jgi:predicted transcriptional regulator
MTSQCRNEVLELLKDGKERSAYEMARVLGRGYATVHKVVNDLLNEHVINRRVEHAIPVKIMFKLNEVDVNELQE